MNEEKPNFGSEDQSPEGVPGPPSFSGDDQPTTFARIDRHPEKPDVLPAPAPAPKDQKRKKGFSGAGLTKKRSSGKGQAATPKPAPKPPRPAPPTPATGASADTERGPSGGPEFSIPSLGPSSAPAYNKSPFAYEEDPDEGTPASSSATPLAIGALLLALAALLVSLGVFSVGSKEKISSTSIEAGAVGTSQILDEAVTETKLDPEVLQALDQSGEQGDPGKPGKPGKRGKPGPPGPAGISSIQLIERTVTGSGAAEVSTIALCPGDLIAVSGGGSITGASGNVALTGSEPLQGLAGWRSAASQVDSAQVSWSLTTYAVCAKPTQKVLDSLVG